MSDISEKVDTDSVSIFKMARERSNKGLHHGKAIFGVKAIFIIGHYDPP